MDIFFMYVLYSTLLHLPPLRFRCVFGGCWDRTQDSCDLDAIAPSHPRKKKCVFMALEHSNSRSTLLETLPFQIKKILNKQASAL